MRTVSIRLESLTEEVLRRVIELYDETVGGNGSRYFNSGTLQYVKEMLTNRSSVEWRFGSRLSGHSKLWIQLDYRTRLSEPVIYFSFAANVDESPGIRKRVQKLEANFSRSVSEFLEERGLAVSGSE